MTITNHKTLKAIILALMISMLFPCSLMAQQAKRGDINGDNEVDVSDVTALISYILGSNTNVDPSQADVNRDNEVDVSDVTTLISYILGSYEFPPEMQEFTIGNVTFVMMPVEGGTFTMGATAEQGSDANDRELPVHEVTLSSYYIASTEVTQELWQAVMGSNPSYFKAAQLPVENVSWEDCQLFIATLNELTESNFRLPTEAEWEFAARGGNKSMGYKYAGGNNLDVVGWYSGNDSWPMLRGTGSYGTHYVATRGFNELELFDMSGNVHEWCQDWFGTYSAEAQTDPTGPASGTSRVYRGGSWYFDEWFCRVSFRNGTTPTYRSYGIGLRLAL